jgi:hypothetical protein
LKFESQRYNKLINFKYSYEKTYRLLTIESKMAKIHIYGHLSALVFLVQSDRKRMRSVKATNFLDALMDGNTIRSWHLVLATVDNQVVLSC